MTPKNGIEKDVDALDLEAVDWVVRLTVGHLSDADREAFDRWRLASPRHERAFAAAADLGGHLRRMPLEIDAQDESDTEQPGNILPFTHPAPRLSRRAFFGGGAVAASLAGGLMALNPPLGLWPSLAELLADERTAAGERRKFSPIAGVDIELNSRSSASRAEGGHGLELISGEAFVAVRAGRPFQVTTETGTVAATDASFNVQAQDGSLCVTCVTGTVNVGLAERRETLSAGRELRVSANGQVRQAPADALVRLAWRQGLLVLRGTPLSEAIPQINRYFPGRLVLTDSAKRAWPVTGTFHIDQIELAVVQLQRLLDVKATRLPGGVVLLG